MTELRVQRVNERSREMEGREAEEVKKIR